MIRRFGKSFAWLNATQFLGAMNDNIFKLLSFFYVIRLLGEERASEWVALGGAIFVIPFLLFTPAAGALADRFSKRSITVFVKVLEIAVMALAVAAFHAKWAPGAYIVLFLMSTQSALFGPSKYGIIPELVPRDQLSAANGTIIMFTYVAIICGTALGPWLGEIFRDRLVYAALVCVGIAIAGTIASLGIEKTPPAGRKSAPSLFVVDDVWRTMASIRRDTELVMAILASAYFSLIGSYTQLNLIPFGMTHLKLTEAQSGYLFFFAAVGIGAGAWLAGRLSGRRVEFGIVPAGALLLAGTTLVIGLDTLPLDGIRAMIFLAGVGAGLFLIPLEAFVQFRAPRAQLGSILAANSFLSWIGVLLGSALVYIFNVALGLPPARGFAIMGAATIVLGLLSVAILPEFGVRFATLLFTRLRYRVRAVGADSIPPHGGAILISNHASRLDPFLILTSQSRRILFVLPRSAYEASPFRSWLRALRAVPLGSGDPPETFAAVEKKALRTLESGGLVCLFADDSTLGKGPSWNGRPFVEQLAVRSRVPIIPVYISGMWNTPHSYFRDSRLLEWPDRGWRRHVAVAFGRAMTPPCTAPQIRNALMETSCEAAATRKPLHRSLAELFIRMARRNRSKRALDDTAGRSITLGEALIGAIALARVLRRPLASQQNVGVLLPPSVGGFLVNVALALLRKTSVNLNFTASAEAFNSAIEQAGLRTIITARAFVEKFPQFANLPGLVFAEDLRAQIGTAQKIRAALVALAAPVCAITPLRRASPDDVATIIFSSGTTGAPKGIMLTHHNIAANIESFSLVLRPTCEDRLCASLPLFHSFGFTCGLWFPAVSGISTSYHVSPLDAAKIVEVVRERKCTALFATPTFLASYMKKANPEDFRTLRVVITGAEKLKARLADEFEAKFGLRPIEGYGTTELAPVATLSLPDVDIDGVYRGTRKDGSVGQPVPGVVARVVDPDTGHPLGFGEPGLLLIKGPNVMKGYLDRPELTAQAIVEGWYKTGDMARIDEEGYVFITDRLARFSKIGGEMVPHLAIEEVYLRALNATDAVLAVASIPCERKGERLVVLYLDAAGDAETLHRIMMSSNLPNLWRPSRDSYFRIDALPMTGSGKLDVKELRRMAARLAAGS
ncbi:MAG: MFS transporter [Kiritimatiellae bacterium]|nr:MFS transporter [Kiritimatiellia bacterium]MDW8458491.1 MFS transporter [Verrucomicrobiota bacterium]